MSSPAIPPTQHTRLQANDNPADSVSIVEASEFRPRPEHHSSSMPFPVNDIAAEATQNPAGGSIQPLPRQPRSRHPVSRLEALPDELLLDIWEHAENEWMAFVCPQFHEMFETEANRKSVLTHFFRTRPGYIHDTREHRAWKRRFWQIVNLPWFMAAVFGSKDGRTRPLMSRSELKAWWRVKQVQGAVIEQTVWTQAMGDFFVQSCKRTGVNFEQISGSVLDRYDGAVIAALNQGCIAAIEFLSGLPLTQTIEERVSGWVEKYNARLHLTNYGSWVRRWTSLGSPAQEPGNKPHPSTKHRTAAVAHAMLKFQCPDHLPGVSIEYLRVFGAFIVAFWTDMRKQGARPAATTGRDRLERAEQVHHLLKVILRENRRFVDEDNDKFIRKYCLDNL